MSRPGTRARAARASRCRARGPGGRDAEAATTSGREVPRVERVLSPSRPHTKQPSRAGDHLVLAGDEDERETKRERHVSQRPLGIRPPDDRQSLPEGSDFTVDRHECRGERHDHGGSQIEPPSEEGHPHQQSSDEGRTTRSRRRSSTVSLDAGRVRVGARSRSAPASTSKCGPTSPRAEAEARRLLRRRGLWWRRRCWVSERKRHLQGLLLRGNDRRRENGSQNFPQSVCYSRSWVHLRADRAAHVNERLGDN